MAWQELTPFGAFGPPPQLHGGNVEGIAAALLRQRMEQQNKPQEIAQMMMQARERQIADALAQRRLDIAQQEADAQSKLYGTHGDLYSAMAQRARAQADTTSAPDQPETFTDDQGRVWRRGSGGNWYPMTSSSQNMPNQSTYDLLLRRMHDLRDASALERQQNIAAKKPNVPFSRADEMADVQAQIDAMNKGGLPATQPSMPQAQPQATPLPEPTPPIIPGTTLDPATAAQYLKKANGNRAVAERMAKSDGWTWQE